MPNSPYLARSPDGGRFTYTYDAVGNRLESRSPGIATYIYDSANQLSVLLGSPPRSTYSYDANGNTVGFKPSAGQIMTWTWDFENRLTREVGNNFPSTLTYNADGRQVRIEGYDADLETFFTTKIVWDGQNELLETDEDDVTKAVNTLQPAGYGNLVSVRRVRWRLVRQCASP